MNLFLIKRVTGMSIWYYNLLLQLHRGCTVHDTNTCNQQYRCYCCSQKWILHFHQFLLDIETLHKSLMKLSLCKYWNLWPWRHHVNNIHNWPESCSNPWTLWRWHPPRVGNNFQNLSSPKKPLIILFEGFPKLDCWCWKLQ